MPAKTITVTNGDGSTKTITIPDRSRFAGVRTMTSGYLYPANPVNNVSQSHFSITKTDDRNFRVVSDLANDNTDTTKFKKIVTTTQLRLGKQRVTFDVTLNGSTVASDIANLMFRFSYRDDQTNLQPVVGSNTFDIDLYDDGQNVDPEIYFAFHEQSSYDISISNLKVVHNYREITVNRTAPVITSDRKGESRPLLSKLVGGASAAYSLRDLNDRNGNNKVVRVRRASDNHERDFLAKEVSNGTLENWVNTQAVLPLDIKALTDDGRTGSVIPVAAAYSLRNLSSTYGGNVVHVRRNIDHHSSDFTAAQVADGTLLSFVNHDFSSSLPLNVDDTDAYRAYSLRNLISTYNGNVVEVRRSSDDRLKSFKANEITDGTLLAFVNQDSTVYTSTFADDTDGWSAGNQGTAPSFNQTVGGVSSAISWTGSIGTFYVKSSTVDGLLELGEKVRITGKAFCSLSTTLKAASSFNTVLSSPSQALVGGEWANFDFTISMDGFGGSTARIGLAPFSSGTSTGTLPIGATFALADITVQIVEANGYVKTWYDQAQGAQHATASTGNQPKIVSNGSLITGGGLLFTGNESLEFNPMSANDLSIFTVINLEDDDMVYDVMGSNSGDGAMAISDLETALYYDGANEEEEDLNTEISTGQDTLYCMTVGQTVGGTGVNFFTNGQQSTEIVLGGGSAASTDFDSIGGAGVNAFFSGTMKEVILYNERIDTRRAVEESIAGHYGITMASFSRDGHVKTWYDQGGEGRDATQTTPESQPKIVENGSVLIDSGGKPEIKFEGAQTLSVSGDPVITASSSGTYSAFSVQTIATNEAGYVYGNTSTTNGTSLYALGGSQFTITNFFNGNLDKIPRGSGQNLLSAVYNNGDAGLLVNGAGTMTNAGTYNFSAGTGDFIIGNRNGGTADATFLTGSIQEIIIYNSDQSVNRTAIESNMGEHYGISSIPAYDNKVDGFVETWYDQSGNGHDAIQDTSSNQPKIVGEITAGQPHKLLPDGILFGVNINLSCGTGVNIFKDVAHGNIFSVLKPLNTGVGNARFFESSVAQGARFLFGDSQSGPNASFRIGGRALNTDGFSHVQSIEQHDNELSLLTGFINYGTAHGTLFLNGSQVITSNLPNMTQGNTDNSASISTAIGSTNLSLTSDFNAKEIIIYTTDQSANRPAIEANINNQYDIYS